MFDYYGSSSFEVSKYTTSTSSFANAYFHRSVSISGSYAIVGASEYDDATEGDSYDGAA